MNRRDIMNQIKFKIDKQSISKQFFFKFFKIKIIQNDEHSIFYRFRMNDANFSHDFLKNSIFDQINRRKRKFSKNDDFDEEILISSFRKFKRQIIS